MKVKQHNNFGGGGVVDLGRRYWISPLATILSIALLLLGCAYGCDLIKIIPSSSSSHSDLIITPTVQDGDDFLKSNSFSMVVDITIHDDDRVRRHRPAALRSSVSDLISVSVESKYNSHDDIRRRQSSTEEDQPELISSSSGVSSTDVHLRRRRLSGRRTIMSGNGNYNDSKNDDENNTDNNNNNSNSNVNRDGDLNVESRVVGGDEAERLRFTYLAAMFKVLNDTTLVHRCGGVLVAPNVVMSAAHCNPKVNVVKIGLHSFHDDQELENKQQQNTNNINNRASKTLVVESFNITKRILHPNFDEFTLNYDVGLYVLNGNSTYNSVKLNDDVSEPKLNSDLHVVGWGFTRFGGKTSEVPNIASVRYMSSKECNMKYATGLVPSRITDSMMCAAGPSRDACQGDSGGPLLMKGNKTDDDVVVGLVSWGYGCADPLYPGVYSRVYSFHQWVKDTLEKNISKQ